MIEIRVPARLSSVDYRRQMTTRGLRAILFLALAMTLVGCTQPTVSPFIQAAPLRGEASDGQFTLVIASPHAAWQAGEAIDVQAELSYREALLPATIGSSVGGVIGFSVLEVNGDRRMEAVRDAACAQYAIAPDRPITAPYVTSGAINPGEPNEAFYIEFFADPLFRLPAGTWRVEAWALLYTGPECGGDEVDLRASRLITVHE